MSSWSVHQGFEIIHFCVYDGIERMSYNSVLCNSKQELQFNAFRGTKK